MIVYQKQKIESAKVYINIDIGLLGVSLSEIWDSQQ